MNIHTATLVALHAWKDAQERIQACRHCVHVDASGALCRYNSRDIDIKQARAPDGRCGPEASLLWIKPWGPAPGGHTNDCKRCGRQPFGINCCHCAPILSGVKP